MSKSSDVTRRTAIRVAIAGACATPGSANEASWSTWMLRSTRTDASLGCPIPKATRSNSGNLSNSAAQRVGR